MLHWMIHMFWSLWLTLLVVNVVAPSDRIVGASPGSGVTWQSSQTPTIKLGIRNKYGYVSLDKFTAVCIVSGPDAKQRKASMNVESDNWGYVSFPDDFDTWAKPGRYHWQCQVSGKRVAAGSFEYRTTSTYSDQLTVHR